MKDIVLVGFGGHASSVADCIEMQGEYRIIGYTDLKRYNECKYPYLGTDDALKELYKKGIHHAAVCIGYLGESNVRERMYEKLKSIGYILPIIIDPSAIVSKSAMIDEGTFVGKMAVVNANAKVGKMAIINTKALVEHDCVIGDFTHIAVAAILCGGVVTENRCFIGAGATVLQSLKIKQNSTVGAGTIITKNIEENRIVRSKIEFVERIH